MLAVLSPVQLLLCWLCLPALDLDTGVAGALLAVVSRCVSHLPQGGKAKADATSPPSKTPLSPPSLGPASSAAAPGDTAQAAAPGSGGKDGRGHRAGADEDPLSKSPFSSPEAELSLAKVAGQGGGSPLPPGGLEVEPEFAAALR